jgi:two-component sensor histidine kinase
MPRRVLLAPLFQRTRAMSWPLRYVATVGLVLAVFALRQMIDPGSAGAPLGHFLIAVLLAAALFDSGSGYLATALSAAIGAWFHLPPEGPAVSDPGDLTRLGVFVVVGATMTTVIEALHRALREAERMTAELRRSERARTLLLHEFRHRTRNDLGSLVGLLMLRARIAPSAAAREALREAADHALALARVHGRLALDDGLDRGAERPTVDTHDFIVGLCDDIEDALFATPLRPVRLSATSQSHPLSAERAVPLGLVVNETVTNALKYAFPEERTGIVQVRFAREAGEYVLSVTDDGIGLPPEGEVDGAPPAAPPRGAGLGTRLLRSLAAQLRGQFARRPGEGGRGTVVELRFPTVEPGG